MTAWKSFGTIECLFITYNLQLMTPNVFGLKGLYISSLTSVLIFYSFEQKVITSK